MKKLPIGVNTQVWVAGFSDKDLWLVDHVAKLGFDAIEVSFGGQTSTFTPAKLRGRLDGAGLACAFCGYLGADRDISSPDASVRERGVEYFRNALAAAADVGAKFFCGPLYAELFRARALTDAERLAEWQRSSESLRKAADIAEEFNVPIALEPLNRFETDFINTAAAAVSMVQQVGSTHVGIHLDTFHMNVEERGLAAAIQSAGDHLVHFHACENDRGAPGTGHLPWPEVCTALDQVGYQGWLVIEGFNRQELDLANGARIWRDFAASPDELARTGLDFLRSMQTERVG